MIDEIPEPPRHKLVITGDGKNTVRYVNSDALDTHTLHHEKHLIVRCGVCGHDSSDWGIMRQHAWEDHDMHHSRKHVGTKIVWRKADLPDARAAIHSTPVIRESNYGEDNNEWDDYLCKLRGDCPDSDAAEIARGKIEDSEQAQLLIEHRPPREPYPDSIETGAEREVRAAPDNPEVIV